MDIHEAAKALDGNQYREEGSRQLFEAMKSAGLVAVFGASDDLMEFRGAIDDEVGAWDGTTVWLVPDGLLQNECPEEDCPHFVRLKKSAATIDAIWGEGIFSWRYETRIPHAKFVIEEDDQLYCEGIVFALKDVGAP